MCWSPRSDLEAGGLLFVSPKDYANVMKSLKVSSAKRSFNSRTKQAERDLPEDVFALHLSNMSFLLDRSVSPPVATEVPREEIHSYYISHRLGLTSTLQEVETQLHFV